MGCHCGDGLVPQTLGRLERFVGLSSTMCHGGEPTVIRRPRWKSEHKPLLIRFNRVYDMLWDCLVILEVCPCTLMHNQLKSLGQVTTESSFNLTKWPLHITITSNTVCDCWTLGIDLLPVVWERFWILSHWWWMISLPVITPLSWGKGSEPASADPRGVSILFKCASIWFDILAIRASTHVHMFRDRLTLPYCRAVSFIS